MAGRGWCVAGLAAALALVEAAAAAQAQAPGGDRQVIYNQGQAAFDKADWTTATQDFVQLLPADPKAVAGRSQGVIASRYAESLLALERASDALPWAQAATRALASAEPALAADAWTVEAGAERASFDYAAAVASYGRAEDLLKPAGVSPALVEVLLGEGATGATVDPAALQPRLAAVLADPAFRTRLSGAERARLEDVAARLAMNLGDLVEAERLSKRAVDDSGGLSIRVTLPQAIARGDAAIAAKLAGRDENAREFLAYTGAGHQEELSWIGLHTGALPVCGGDGLPGGVLPDDRVVLSLAISDQGAVTGAIPVYASRPGEVGEAFARAVGEWRWDPAAIAKASPFLRANLQLELRCQGRPELADFAEVSYRELAQVAGSQGLLTPPQASFLASGGHLRLATRDPRLETPGGVLLRVLAGRTSDRGGPDALWRELDQAGAPAVAYAVLADTEAHRSVGRWSRTPQGLGREAAQGYAVWTPRFLQRFPDDPAGERLLMSQALALEQAGDFKGAQPLLDRVIAMPAAASDRERSLHALALLHRAITLDRTGDGAGSRAMLERSGLNSETCALFDTHPLPQSLSSASFSFPEEAMRWRFEGYVLTDFDIAANGSVAGVRATVSYPPFIFDDASVKGVKVFRYVPPRLGGQALGCQGQTQPIDFQVGY